MAEVKIISPYAGFQEKFVRSNVDVVFGGGQLAGGKAIPLSANVLTPNGWVKNGDLKVGDFVSTPFGKSAKILQIFDHKDKDIYRIKTSDGRVTECSYEHLWAIRTKKQKAKFNKHKDFRKNLTVCDTAYLLKMFDEGKKMYIPIPHAQEFSEKEYVIHPYVMGVLIGDGCISDKTLNTTKRCLTISNTENDIVAKVYSLLDCYKLTIGKGTCNKDLFSYKINEYKGYLNKVGLNVKSYERFIPQEYLWGSIEQRKQLLYGLMDTDGSVGAKNRYSFCTTSKRLCEDFIYLCRSLGYIATVKIDNRRDKYTSGVAYDIGILTNDIVFSSDKHLRKYRANLEKYPTLYKRTNDHVYIDSIEKVGVMDARCIFIEDDMHLYIIDDFITTHNSFGAILSCAEPSLDPEFKACFLRTNLDDFKAGGGLIDSIKQAYGNSVHVTTSKKPRATFKNGAFIECMHVADQTLKALEDDFKGTQYDMIYFDELTNFNWLTFCFLFSRNRGTAKWTNKMRATTNPKKNHWVRDFIDWYVGIDGQIIPEREGVVRYFFNAGRTVKDVVWGNTKEEVYYKCKGQIDEFLKNFNGDKGDATYKDVILSFTFYKGETAGNKAFDNKYAGSVAAMGEVLAKENVGNWNIELSDDEDCCITYAEANSVVMNDPQVNGDKWITCDLADVGKDNTVLLYWNGFNIEDIRIITTSGGRRNAEEIILFAKEHDVADTHIIYDGTGARYMRDYIPDAIEYYSASGSRGMYGRMYNRLKDVCYSRFVEMVKRGYLSMSDDVANKEYKHQKLRLQTNILNEFIEECQVIRFKEGFGGKKSLLSKKEMNAKLGKERSMDITDPCAMRMLPILDCLIGEELDLRYDEDDDDDSGDDMAKDYGSIYDNTTWY